MAGISIDRALFFLLLNETTNWGHVLGGMKMTRLTLMHQVGSCCPTELLPARSKVKSFFPKQKYHKMLRRSFLASLCVFPFQGSYVWQYKVLFDANVPLPWHIKNASVRVLFKTKA